ncbi:unnamed protein product [Schistocephalus solidus]|uniref:Transposase n=1 Tax=Schistocephalus solidus TaxID=70667 RepID=A0A183T5V3_SCHSO|nr:unnamed protein product [Schistocephalus solidus]
MIEEFQSVLNPVFPDIQFTMEAEINNQLPFLDVLVHRKSKGHLTTTVYMKPTNTRQILSYHKRRNPSQGNDRVTRETIETWHTETTSINRCVALSGACQALRA